MTGTFRIAGRLSAVEGDRNDERAGLRFVEIIDPAHCRRRTAERSLRVHAGVLGPGDQVPPRHPQIHAGEPEQPGHPGLVEGVPEGYFAELHKAARLDEGGGRSVEHAARASEPRLTQRYRHAGSRARNLLALEVGLPEDEGSAVAELLG